VLPFVLLTLPFPIIFNIMIGIIYICSI
jgi:hypothetical protein